MLETLERPTPALNGAQQEFTPPLATPAPAAPGGWFTCVVGMTGPASDGNIYIALQDSGGAFPLRWFVAFNGERKEMLAVALAAITANLRVVAYLATTDAFGTINNCYLAK